MTAAFILEKNESLKRHIKKIIMNYETAEGTLSIAINILNVP